MAVTVVVTNTYQDEMYGPEHPRIIRRWLITSDKGFRADIPECPCGLRKQIGPIPKDAPDYLTVTREVEYVYSVPKVECLCYYPAGRCTRATAKDRDRRCHGWHQSKIDHLVALVDGKPRKHPLRSPGVTRYRGGELVPVLIAWPERRMPAQSMEVELCQCADCVRTAELLIK